MAEDTKDNHSTVETKDPEDHTTHSEKEKKTMDEDKKALYIVYVYSAENIPISDRRGTTDPYIVAKLETQKKETPVIKETLDPKWNDALLLLPYSGKPDSQVILELWDWNMIQHHAHLGSIKFESNYKTPGHRPELKELEKDGKQVVGGKAKTITKVKLKLWNLNPFQFEGRLIFTRFVARKVRFSANREILKVKQKTKGLPEKEKEKEKEKEPDKRNNPYWKFTWGERTIKYGKGISKIGQDQYGTNTCTWETVEGGLEFEFNEKTVLEQKLHIQFCVDSIHHDEPYEASVYIHEIIDPILVEIIAAYATKIHLRTKNFYTEPVGMDYNYKII